MPGQVLIWDTEHTSWEGSYQRGWRGFVPGTTQREWREIIQVHTTGD